MGYRHERLAVGCIPHFSFSGHWHGLGVDVEDWLIEDVEVMTGPGCALVGEDLRSFGNLVGEDGNGRSGVVVWGRRLAALGCLYGRHDWLRSGC